MSPERIPQGIPRRVLATGVSLCLASASLALLPAQARAGDAPAAARSNRAVSLAPLTVVDATGSAMSTGGREPSITVDPSNPNRIAITRFDTTWNGGTAADLLYSVDGGSTWTNYASIPPPPGLADAGALAPADQSIDFGRDGTLYGAFLTCTLNTAMNGCTGARVVTGSTSDPTSPASWAWRPDATTGTQITSGNRVFADQPWLRVNRDRDHADQDDVYVSYEDLRSTPAEARVAVSHNAHPVNITQDQSPGPVVTDTNTSGAIRLATDPRNGAVYALFQTQTTPGTLGDPQNITYRINRSTDGGATWPLGPTGQGLAVATADTHQGVTYKFGTVNALLGGIDHAAVDPSNGDVYVAYGADVSGNNQIRMRRLTDDGHGSLTVGTEYNVSASTNAALPSVAVLDDGTVGVLYTTYEGMNGNGFPTFAAHLARSVDHGVTFTDQVLRTFQSDFTNDGTAYQRVLGDYQVLRAVGNRFYGAFPGNDNGATPPLPAPPIHAMFFTTVPQTTTTTSASSANPSVYGQPVTFTATVAPVPDGGTVSFRVDGSPLGGPVPVDTTTGQATSAAIATLSPGPHTVDAVYGGNGDFASSTATTLVQTVNQAPVTTTLVSSGPSTAGQNVTFTDTVCPAGGSADPATPPSGTVTFRDGGTPLGTGTLSPGGGTNCAQTRFGWADLLPGTHTVTAQYSGDGNYLAGPLESVTQTVGCTRTITGSVAGTVVAGSGSTCIVDATVSGTVQGASGGALFVSNSTVKGSILSSDGTRLGVCGSTITGSVAVSHATGFVVIGDPGDDGCAGNRITGLVSLADNHSGAELIANHIGGSVQVQGTTGTGPFPEDDRAEIEGNTILGSLSCSGNVPPPTNGGHPNTVTGIRTGQCANL
ncbi:Ig-like domain-containing protein [Kitasatospora sp. NPDC048545]|uniref:Ig-like domain-containing protein n=1 Tax=Kitasatospora sp. NPDC048545 TaxID=3157208 RepID=UPI0033CE5D9E